jgi:hypothetical protein
MNKKAILDIGGKPLEPMPAKTLPATGDTSGLIAMAINADLDIAKLERLMEMKEHEEEKTAKACFNVAMASVQKIIEPIIADAENLQTSSRYSKLTTIVSTLAPLYTEEGFSVSFGTCDCSSQKLVDDGWFRTTAELSHVGGYTKEYYVDLPADTRGPKGNINKTVIHGTKSAITYARVILMGLMFNFTTSEDVDDDGNSSSAVPKPTAEEKTAREKRPMQKPATDKQRIKLQDHVDGGKISKRDIDYINKNLGTMTRSDATHILKIISDEQSEHSE